MICHAGIMENFDSRILQFNTQAQEGAWLQFCDPTNAFVLRDCETLVALWDRARSRKALPSREDLPVSVLKPYLPRLAMVERVQKDPPLFKFRVVGTVVTRTLTNERGSASITRAPPPSKPNAGRSPLCYRFP
jgi:hypothetical protein